MPTPAIVFTRPAPMGVEIPCAYLDDVLAFQAANGGPFLTSLELEYAVRRLTRAWILARLPERTLRPWLGFAAATAVGYGAGTAPLTRGLLAWAIDECQSVPVVGAPSSAGGASAA